MQKRKLASYWLALVLVGGSLAVSAQAASVRVAEGPVCLRDYVAYEWGGHTYPYLVEGDRFVFWAAKAADADTTSFTAYVGQYPKPGVEAPAAVNAIKIEEPIKRLNQPHLMRSPDGYLHVFVDYVPQSDKPASHAGVIRYYRSERPDDITSLVDRTELLPDGDYGLYHLRLNVGVSRDGKRAALVVLAYSNDGKDCLNIPVVFRGERKGLDYDFQPPVQYAEQMPLFYPQVAVVDSGIVVVGQLWEDEKPGRPNRNVTARLLHFDWEGNMLHREDFPIVEDGGYSIFDIRPLDEDWTKLALMYNKVPLTKTGCRHELWQYDTMAQQTSLLWDADINYNSANAGKWLPLAEDKSLFLNDPSMGQLRAWVGDFVGGGPVEQLELPHTNPRLYGYDGNSYISVPTPLTGSVSNPGSFYVLIDCLRADRPKNSPDPCALLLYRLEVELDKAEGES